MDRRLRNYYFITTGWEEDILRNSLYRIAAPSIKYHSTRGKYEQLRPFYRSIGFYPQAMISCRKGESEALEYELRKSERVWNSIKWVKIEKELVGH